MTLVEVLVALLVTGIILSAVYFVLLRVTLMSKQQQEYVDAQDGMRNTMLLIEKDIRRSSQSVDVEEVDGCYVIRDNEDVSSVFEYCISDSNLIRNGHVIIDGVDTLNIKIVDVYIEVSLMGKFGERELKHEKKIFLRTTS